MFDDNLPLSGFHFKVSIGDNLSEDAAFQEVSGISQEMTTESINEGGENRFAHKVPGRTSYSDLVLKRGVMAGSSSLATWCKDTLSAGLSARIEPKMLHVQLLDEEHNPLVSWTFVNAYPIKWEIGSMDAMKSDIVVETITFAYNHFVVEKS